jgi:hypothetical protein
VFDGGSEHFTGAACLSGLALALAMDHANVQWPPQRRSPMGRRLRPRACRWRSPYRTKLPWPY